eukprot:171240-Chlamydomonas_euryale.AAC.5
MLEGAAPATCLGLTAVNSLLKRRASSRATAGDGALKGSALLQHPLLVTSCGGKLLQAVVDILGAMRAAVSRLDNKDRRTKVLEGAQRHHRPERGKMRQPNS